MHRPVYRQLAFHALFAHLLTLAAPALAWNSPGHQIIALLAHEQMNPATRAKAIELLRSHPRFDDHFESAMPREVARGSSENKDLWHFAHAATWPDQVRDAKGGVNHQDVSLFNRPWWHFVNEPVFLSDEQRRQLSGDIRTNRRRDPPQDPDDTNMNVIQALKNSTRILADRSAPPEKRAVHLCWVMHLAGDSHQPLHSAALYTTHRFRGGDRGGNLLEFEHRWDLHAFWDEQISNDEPFETLLILAADLNQNQKLAEAGRSAAEKLDPGQWIDECFELATTYAYTKEVLQKVAEREGHSRLGPLALPPTYRAEAEVLAERRAVESAHRLAKTLEKALEIQ